MALSMYGPCIATPLHECQSSCICKVCRMLAANRGNSSRTASVHCTYTLLLDLLLLHNQARGDWVTESTCQHMLTDGMIAELGD